jgi:uncharacterized protein
LFKIKIIWNGNISHLNRGFSDSHLNIFFLDLDLEQFLMPVFAIFFPVEIAIALTGVVHFSNNLFKMSLVGKRADKEVLLKFGIPAILASFAGAWLLIRITKMPSLLEYQLWDKGF